MKKTFLVRRNSFLSPDRISWGTIAVAFVCTIALVRFFAPNIFWALFAPVFRSVDGIVLESHSIIENFGNTKTLASRNEQLANDNAILASENEILSQKVAAIVGLSTSLQKLPGIIAGVIARPPESPYDSLLVSGGSDVGVVKGMEAFGEGQVPLGVVDTVYNHFSRVILFSASGVATQGWVGHGNIAVTLLGSGGGSMKISLPRSTGIVVGDHVFVPGPGMLPIGTIARIEGDPSSPSVTLHVMPILNLFSVTWVSLRDVGSSLRSQTLTATSTAP